MQHKENRDFLMPLPDSKDREIMNYANSTTVAHALCREAKKTMRFKVATPLPELRERISSEIKSTIILEWVKSAPSKSYS